jgi:hypothetical protein
MGTHPAVGALLAVAATILIIFAIGYATGSPASPTATLSGTINPAQAQSFQLTFETQVASTLPPNSIYQLTSTFLYSISESNAQGGTTVIAQSQHVAATVQSFSWPVATMTATITISTVAVCVSSSCAGVVSNVTATVAAQTWGGAFTSPTSVITFSSQPAYQHVAPVGPVSYSAYIPQFAGALILGIGFGVLAGAAFTTWHEVVVTIGGILIVVGVVVVVV